MEKDDIKFWNSTGTWQWNQLGRFRLPILAVVVIAALMRLPIFLMDLENLLKHIPDDGFYYFQLASNFVQGKLSTLDGIHITNGYHPLWLLNIVPFFALKPLDLTLPLRLVLIYSFLLSAATAWLLGWIVNRATGKIAPSILVFAAYILNPFVFKVELLSEPACLSNFLIVCLLVMTCGQAWGSRFSTKRAVLFGVFGGLMMLARTDNLPFYGAFWLLVLVWSKPKPWAGLLLAGFVSGLLIFPWFLFNLLTFGTIVQSSAVACPYIAMANEPATLSQLFSVDFSNGLPARIFELQLVFRYSLIMHGFLLVMGIALVMLSNAADKMRRTTQIVLLGLLISIILLYAHSVLFRYIRDFHVACSSPFVILLLFIVLDYLISQPKFTRWLLYSCLGLYFVLNSLMVLFIINERYNYYEADVLKVVDWVNAQPNHTCAIYDGGSLSYLTDGRVFPIDGNINNEAQQAVMQGNLYDYMKTNGVKYLLGWDWVVGRYRKFWGVDFDSVFTEIYHEDHTSPIGRFRIWVMH